VSINSCLFSFLPVGVTVLFESGNALKERSARVGIQKATETLGFAKKPSCEGWWSVH